MARHSILVLIHAEDDEQSGPFTQQDLLEAVQATLHEIYPVADWPIVPTVLPMRDMATALDQFVAADDADPREEALSVVFDEWVAANRALSS